MSKQHSPHHLTGVRVIAGKHRGRKIDVLDHPGLRPTPDRVRETVFNWLQFDLPDAHVLDAFAGSGAMGLECLSRGAASVHFIEQDGDVAEHISDTLQQWGERHARVQIADALRQNQPHSAYDIIFIDPPFADNLHQQAIDHFCQPIWLKPHGFLYIESPDKLDNLTLPEGYQWYKTKQAGRLRFGLIGCVTDE